MLIPVFLFFQTSVSCISAGQFDCPMVVSMRPVPEDKLDAAVQCTHVIPLAHGGPVHIGHPSMYLFQKNEHFSLIIYNGPTQLDKLGKVTQIIDARCMCKRMMLSLR